MPSPRTKRVKADPTGALRTRVEDLELRVSRLEARLRVALTVVRREQAGATGAGREAAPAVRRRPRCPGCTLELPRGRRTEVCVWCGFRFDAVKHLLR